MAKTVELQIEKSRNLIEGLRKHLATGVGGGVDTSEINNMEQVLGKMTAAKTMNVNDRTYSAHMLPRTDDILERAVNISIGVVDKGLGSGYGINILSTEDEIRTVGGNIRRIILGL